MKGVILATTLFVLMMGISLGFMYWLSIDDLRYQSQFILKQVLTESLVSLSKVSIDKRDELVFKVIEEGFELHQPNQTNYRIEVLGFSSYPLGVHVALYVKPLYRPENMWYRFEETLIEVRDEY